MIKKWTKLSSKKLLVHPRIVVIEDTVKLPNGESTDYIKFEGERGASTIIAENNTGQILVQKEYSYPPDKILYQFPGGGINKGETSKIAAARELCEESDLGADLQEIGWFYINNRRNDAKMYVFIARNLSKLKGQKDIEEEIENYWLSDTEIDNLIEKQEICIQSALATWAIYKNYKSKV